MPERLSWHALHAAWLRKDLELKAMGEAAFKRMRPLFLPPKLSGRLDRMVRRIVSNAHLLASLERRQTPDWMKRDAALARARWQLFDSVRTLRRHIHRTPDHPKGGLGGRVEEFSPMLRRFLKGQDDDVKFITSVGWALRLLDREANPGEEE